LLRPLVGELDLENESIAVLQHLQRADFDLIDRHGFQE
jgi:hypothetical protein